MESEKKKCPPGWKEIEHEGKQVYLNVYTGAIQNHFPTISFVYVPPPNHDKKVTCSHILIKHSGSVNPSSWKSRNITINKLQALAELLNIRKKIVNGESFSQLASVHSDCPSQLKGGDLGEFSGGVMDREFEKAAFGLKVGEMSQPVRTPHGYHLILRTA